jgi:LysR family transcriptional activator of glutamate synthase operon
VKKNKSTPGRRNGEYEMEIRFLEEFMVLASCLNYSEAASQLHMAQSTLSKHIQSLETELGGQLFKRTTRQISLSELGGIYLPYAQKIVLTFKDADGKLREYTNKNAFSFTLAAVHNMQYFSIDRYIIGFCKAHPECSINVVEGEEAELWSMFMKKQTNFFTAYTFGGETPDYDFIPIGENHIVASMPKSHRLAGSRELALEQLKNESLLFPNRNSLMFRAVMSAFTAAGISPRIVYEGNSIGCIELVKSGMGILLHPKEISAWNPDKSVICTDIVPNITYRYGLGYREQGLSADERKLIDYLQELRLGN